MINFIRKFFEVKSQAMTASSGYDSSELYELLTGGGQTAGSGVTVSEQTVMAVSAVYASVNLIGGAIASLPLPVYRRTDEGREKIDHDIWWLLNEQPIPRVSAPVFWEYLVSSLLLHGDAFARIHRRGLSPKIDGFEPLHPISVRVHYENGRLYYVYYDDDSKLQIVDQDDMIHIPGPGFDGKRGKSQIRHVLRNSAGIAIAADDYSASFFGEGMKPDFGLEVPGTVTEDQQNMIRKTWSDRHSGLGRRLPALLVGGVKVHELTMNAEDAQLIATRQFQVEDIARAFGVPPFMIGHTEKTSSWGSGVEQMGIGFVKYTLQRHLKKIEQEINRKCFRTARNFVEFKTAGLERGDFKSRNEGYRIALGRAGEPAWMTVNEVRKLENLPPIDGGNSLIKEGEPNEPPAQTT